MSDEDLGSESNTRVSTGVAGLDAILRGVFVRGGIYLLLARPGSGKTVLGNRPMSVTKMREEAGDPARRAYSIGARGFTVSSTSDRSSTGRRRRAR